MRKKMMAMAAVTAMMVSAGTGSVAMAAQEMMIHQSGQL